MDRLETTIGILKGYGISLSRIYGKLNMEKHIFDKRRASVVQETRERLLQQIELAFADILQNVGPSEKELEGKKVGELQKMVDSLMEMIKGQQEIIKELSQKIPNQKWAAEAAKPNQCLWVQQSQKRRKSPPMLRRMF